MKILVAIKVARQTFIVLSRLLLDSKDKVFEAMFREVCLCRLVLEAAILLSLMLTVCFQGSDC